MKHLFRMILVATVTLALGSALAPAAHAGDGGAGGGGTATFCNVPFVGLVTAAQMKNNTIPGLTYNTSGAPTCTSSPTAACGASLLDADVAQVSCTATSAGSVLGTISYIAVVQDVHGPGADKLADDVQDVMNAVAAQNHPAICNGLDSFEKDVFDQGANGKLSISPAAQLIVGAEMWKTFHSCGTGSGRR